MKTKRGFGRLLSLDVRDERFLMTRKLPPAGTPLPTRKTWRIAAKNLNQLATGTCVAHAWVNFLRCEPIQTSTGPKPYDLYRRIVQLDEWTGNDIEATAPDRDLQFGTSVRAGAQAVTETGRLKSYLWAFSLRPLTEWVLTNGSVVGGFNWYSSFEPDAEGIIRITPRARVSGGHAVLIRGVDMVRGLVRITNSWGDEWGVSGDCFIPLRDLERLMLEDGEACTATEIRVKAVKV
jgi:hypothetical protein